MAENEKVLEPEVPVAPESPESPETKEVQPETPVTPESPETPEEAKPAKKGNKFWAGLKERCRKFVVNLKRRPMNIAFFVLIISTIVNLCCLGSYAQVSMVTAYSGKWGALCMFINQLFCILVIMLFLNSFPKRAKKPNIVQFVLLFVFMAILMGISLYLFITWGAARIADTDFEYRKESFRAAFPTAYTGVLVHFILVAIATVLTATYPLYGKLINKINTKKVVESNEIKEEIDTSEEV